MKKIAVSVVTFLIVLVLFSYFFPDVFHYMNFSSIKMYHQHWISFYESHRTMVVIYFLLFNILMAMLPVPGISMISFLGGSIFGFWPGLIYSSLATGIGNLGGFFLGRYFLREWVIKKYGHRVSILNQNWERALFSFRLFPLIPSFVANLIMGVSPLKWWTFFWVSWLGRIPMVLVYTYAGVQVATIERVEDILSLPLLLAFTALAVFPWLLKYYGSLIKLTR